LVNPFSSLRLCTWLIFARISACEVEAKAIGALGHQHLLLLTGESRKASSPEYIAECARILRPYFASLGIEGYPLETHEYRELYEAGIDTLTIYQEVYDEDLYASVHLAGPKRVHRYWLDAPERACEAGLSGVNIGALLGLGEWRKEAFFTGLRSSREENLPVPVNKRLISFLPPISKKSVICSGSNPCCILIYLTYHFKRSLLLLHFYRAINQPPPTNFKISSWSPCFKITFSQRCSGMISPLFDDHGVMRDILLLNPHLQTNVFP